MSKLKVTFFLVICTWGRLCSLYIWQQLMWLRREPVLLHVNNKYRQTDNLYLSTMVKKAVQLVESCVNTNLSWLTTIWAWSTVFTGLFLDDTVMDCPEITITTTEKAHPNIKFNLFQINYPNPRHGQEQSCCQEQLDFPLGKKTFIFLLSQWASPRQFIG